MAAKRIGASMAAAVLVTGAVPASAADAPAIEEIRVTAQKIERSLQDTPESVAIITGETIERRGIQQLSDVFDQTANVFDLGNNEGFGIRGVTSTSASTGGGNGELATYFYDGVALTGFAKRFVPVDMWDIEQVEILRGPQSTNLGRNAMMGAVFLTSKRPELGRMDSRFLLGTGNASRQEAAAMVNAPLGDRAAFRFSGEYLSHDGYIDNPTRGEDDFDARENITLRGKLLFEPTDRLSILAALQYVSSERGQNLFRLDLVGDPDDRENFGTLKDQEDLDGYLGTLDVSYAINESWSMRSITTYLETDYDRIDDDDLSAAGGDAFRGRITQDENFAEELRFDYASDTLRGTVGLYYIDVKVDGLTTGLVNLDPALLGVPATLLPFYPPEVRIDIASPNTSDTENFSLFTEWEWDFAPRFSLIAGLRYEDEQQDNFNGINNSLDSATPLPDPAVAGAQATALFGPALGAQVEAGITQVNAILGRQLAPSQEQTEPEFDVVLGKLGGVWRIREDVQVSAIWSQGYRSGGTSLSLTGTLVDFDPEELDNFELGLRTSFWDGTATFNANAYYSDWTDQQVTIGLGGNIFDTVIENVGESTLYGFEAEFSYTPSSTWSAFATLGYSDTEFDEYVSALDGDLSGNEFAFSPNWTGAIGGTRYFGDFYVGANVTYQSESFGDVQNSPAFELDERTLVNVQAGWSGERVDVRLYVKNLFDDTYFTNLNAGLAPGAQIARLGDPTEYGLQVFFTP